MRLPRDFGFRRLLSRDPGEWKSNIIAGDVAQVINDRSSIAHSSSEANVAIRSNQDQCVAGNAIGVVGVPIAIDQRVVRDRGHVARARDGIRAQGAMVGSRQLWRGLISEGEQREVRAMEEIEEPDLLIAPGMDAERVGSAIPGTNARRVVEVTCQWATSVVDAQLAGISEGFPTRGEIGDGLAHILSERSVTGGCGGKNARGDRQTFSLIGVQQGV